MANRIFRVCAVIGPLLAGVSTAAQSPSPGAPEAKESLKTGSEQFQARAVEAARAVENLPGLKKLSSQQRQRLVEFVAGNLLYALTHELGHALIAEMDLPVLGREEDAADAFAVVAMLNVRTEISDRVLTDAASGWFFSDKRSRAHGIELRFYHEHGLEQQRAYQIVCLVVGSDPSRFAELAAQVTLPERRQKSCQRDYARASRSWSRILEPWVRSKEQPIQKMNAVYGPATGELEPIAEAVRDIRLLETITDFAAERYAWPRPITLEMKECGHPDVYWDPATQRISMCYELAEDFAALYRNFGITPRKGN
jgi:hypothetical protein